MPEAPLALPRREDLEQRTVSFLNHGNSRNPDVYLIAAGERQVVVKDFLPRGWWIRSTWGRFSIWNEMATYRALADHPSVPTLIGPVDELAFVVEYRPGQRMTRRLRGRVSAEFPDELARAIRDMHEQGVIHLDLRHRSNVMVGEDGHPVLIDFASAIRFRPGSWAHRWIMPLLSWIDMGALRKWQDRLTRDRWAT